MARDQFQTLTEPMYYTLLALCEPRNGSEITEWVKDITKSRVALPPGTLYALLAQFLDNDLIERVKSSGRGKHYLITNEGRKLLIEEEKRLKLQVDDFLKYYKK